MTMVALSMVVNHARMLEGTVQRYQSQEFQRMDMMDRLQSNVAQRELDKQMAELKMAALTTAIEKGMHAFPLIMITMNKWLKARSDEKSGKATPREAKSMKVLRTLAEELSRNPMSRDNPDMIKGMLKGAGVSEDSIDGVFEIFQEFAIEDHIDQAEKKIHASLLGKDGPENTGLQRLLALAHRKTPDGETIVIESATVKDGGK